MDINNHGEDAFKPEVYGDTIILERRITESAGSTVLKDQHGIVLVLASSIVGHVLLLQLAFLG